MLTSNIRSTYPSPFSPLTSLVSPPVRFSFPQLDSRFSQMTGRSVALSVGPSPRSFRRRSYRKTAARTSLFLFLFLCFPFSATFNGESDLNRIDDHLAYATKLPESFPRRGGTYLRTITLCPVPSLGASSADSFRTRFSSGEKHEVGM